MKTKEDYEDECLEKLTNELDILDFLSAEGEELENIVLENIDDVSEKLNYLKLLY